jgi:hypothetical protein
MKKSALLAFGRSSWRFRYRRLDRPGAGYCLYPFAVMAFPNDAANKSEFCL